MTMYGSEYDGSDYGNSDGTQEACDFCFDPKYVEYQGQNRCLDCIEKLFWHETNLIAREHLMFKYKRPGTVDEMMDWMQVELIDNPKTVDFVGFKVSFLDDEREISLMELESSARFIKGKKNNMGEIV
jgi:hypothetical protein